MQFSLELKDLVERLGRGFGLSSVITLFACSDNFSIVYEWPADLSSFVMHAIKADRPDTIFASTPPPVLIIWLKRSAAIRALQVWGRVYRPHSSRGNFPTALARSDAVKIPIGLSS